MGVPLVTSLRIGAVALLALAGIGCVRHVEVEIAASPSVPLAASTVAVVAVDRECRDVAEALVDELHALDALDVDPAARVQLQVFECGRSLNPVVDVHLDGATDRRRVTIDGRAHAVVAVTFQGAAQAHLIGSSRHEVQGAWGGSPDQRAPQPRDVLAMRSAATRALDHGLARDLATQISPMPRHVQRRTWPNASGDTARGLHTRAVLAEQRGDLDEAHRLAHLALRKAPLPTTAAYVQELERLRLLSSPR